MEMLKGLTKKKNEPQLQAEWTAAKKTAKVRLAKWLKETINFDVDPDMLFDCQFKRIHEYKRQLLNAIYLIHRYLMIKGTPPHQRSKFQRRFSFFGGKAAPGYVNAKIIIKLIGNIAEVVNNDPDVNHYMKVCFVPNYSVTVAQMVVPASDLSQHISTAGTEASGTSNMKFVMNGGLIVGTMDGANVEICEEAGGEQVHFIFGARETELPNILSRSRNEGHYPVDRQLARVFEAIRQGRFSLGDGEFSAEINAIVDTLCNASAAGTWDGDKYLVCHDFPSYVEAQKRVDRDYQDKAAFASRSIQSAGSTAKFTTDRSMADYAKSVWELPKCARPAPKVVPSGPTRAA